MAQATHSARLKTRYEQEIRPELIRRFSYSTPMQAPKIKKITLNMGVGDAKQDAKALEAATEQLATIAGQRPSVRRARKSIAAFKLREGMPVGVSVTLRGQRSYEFLDRLMSVAIPRIRDFRGMNPRSFDGRGNYSLGVREQIIFPEIDYDTIDQTRGLDITITTSAASDLEAFVLLQLFGFPFAHEGRPAGAAPADPAAGSEEADGAAAAPSAATDAAAVEAPVEEAAAQTPPVDDVAAEAEAEAVAPEAEAEAVAPEAAPEQEEPVGWGEEPGVQEDFTGVEEASREPEDVPGEADGEETGHYAEEAAAPQTETHEPEAPVVSETVADETRNDAIESEAAPAALDSPAPVNDVPVQEPASQATEADAEAGEE
jgi:large subunit ribosomal protein L5